MDKHYSGVSEYTLNLLREIFKQDKKNKYKLFYNSWHDVSNRIPEFNYPNVKVVATNYSNKILNYILFKFFNWPKIDKKLGRVDLMFMPHFNFIALSDKCKKVITVHDLSFMRHPHYFSVRHNFWQKNINLKKFLPQFDKIITVSDHTRRDVRELCDIEEKNIKTVYSGISKEYTPVDKNNPRLQAVEQKYKLPKNFILYLGNLEPRKNIEGIIQAYELFRKNKGASWQLVIAGAKSWKYNNIYELAQASKFRDDILFINYVDAEDKVYLYNLAEIFIFPSFYEGFGFPPLEAAACGAPVIASNTSSLSEILDNAAILVDPYKIDEIAQAMTELIRDEKLREQLSSAGLKKAKQYDWKKTAQEVLEIFEEISG